MTSQAADCVRHLASMAGVTDAPRSAYDWPAIEASVGLPLPEDYKLLAQSLPPGWFRHFARLQHPTGSVQFFRPDVSGQLDVMRDWRANGHGQFPYPIYPEPGGLLPWGKAVGGGMLFWLTSSADPNDWPVIATTAQYDHWDRFDGTACQFLTAVATARYDTSMFAEGPIRVVMDPSGARVFSEQVELSERGPVFTPDPPRPPPRPPSGTKPDFWLRQVLQTGGDRTAANEYGTLAGLAGPPPGGVAPVDWDAVHARLGFRLPSDYRSFADTYGPGMFGDVTIAVPGADGDLDLFALLGRLAAQIQGQQRQEWDPPLYPEPGGAICWGETTDGYTCGWAPAGTDPDTWSTVVVSPNSGLKGFEFQPGISFSTALKEYKVFHDQHPGLALALLPPRDPSAGPVTFTPAPKRPA